jgi:FkbH-like protein
MEQLEWLPAHPDFRGALRAARDERDPAARLRACVSLANYNRDFVVTDKLDRLLQTALAELGAATKLTAARVALLSSHTVDHLTPALRVAGVSRRLAVSTHVAPYGTYRQSLLGDDPALAAFQPQFILLALDGQDVAFDLPLEAAESEVDHAIRVRVDELRRLWRCARERYGAQVIQQTLVPVTPSLFGSFEALVPATPFAMTERFNAAIRTAAGEDRVLLLDLAWHPIRGSSALGDPVRWHQAKQLVSPLLAPLYGDLLARVVAGALGLSRKCLVLDLDNTLWGGVVGDDGIEGLQLGQGSPTGEAFLAFQRYVSLLAKRGIVLAVCSKNHLEVAEGAFTNHPEMALRRTDIAAFVANWSDKAQNLRNIAHLLDLGTDSFVFVDDNPAEREIIRRELPEVAVPELPEEPAYYAARLSAAGYFETSSFTADDAARSRNYVANAERRSMAEQATDLDGYLRSLDMTLVTTGVGPVELPRATQLLNKSNQFNLTTRRYTQVEMSELVTAPSSIGLCLRLVDRFSDNGLISVIIARQDPAWAGDELLIDTWLMSCRVLGRQVEAAALQVLAERARKRGVRALIGEFRPTPKNSLVVQHYEKLGFTPAAAPAGASAGATFWRFDVASQSAPTHFIQLSEQA